MDKKSIYILNLEGAYIYKEKLKHGEYRTDRKKLDKDGNETNNFKFTRDKLYSATIPYSLETIRAMENIKNELDEIGKKYYTKLFINVNFDKHYKVEDEIKFIGDNGEVEVKKVMRKELDKEKVRDDLYINGFKLDGIEYVMFKRGGSKARTASAIFVKKLKFKELYSRCLLGLDFKENDLCDLTSKNAYISLIMSGIIGTVDFKKEEILIIDDVMGKEMKVRASVTERNKNGEIVVRDYEDYKVINNMTDGQVLIDESKFEESDLLRGYSVALLRNDFMKGAGFNTKMQAYFSENKIDKLYDLYRGWVDAKSIKLIITPSSCKFLKFSNKFKSEKDCYIHWWNSIDSTFGVVKTDHVGNYGYSNRLSYQMINSLELNYDEIKKIAKDEIHYIKMLKNNWDGDSEEYRKNKSKRDEISKLKNEMTYFMHHIGNNSLKESTGEMLSSLLSVNSDFRFSKKLKEYKKHQVTNYINDVKTGKVRIKNSIYSILFSCPFEMLRQATQKEPVNESISSGWEAYCSNYKNNQELCLIRNPQINSGNIAHVINKYHDEYKWFNLSDFVVILNTYDVDIMNRLQGCDFDIDSALILEDEIIVRKAKECMDKYYTPINAVKGSTELRPDNMRELSNLDNYLGGSTRTIGQIVNKSAICNAYMWDAIYNNYDEPLIKKLYDASSMLSSFSQIAIDMAKKSFLDGKGDRLSLLNEMQKINSWEINGKTILSFEETRVYNEKKQKYEVLKKMIVPKFFNEIADNQYRIIRPMNCGMDYLQDVMNSEIGKTLGTKIVEIKELLVKPKELKGDRIDKRQIEKVLVLVDTCNKKINWTRIKSSKENMSEKARYYICKNAKDNCVSELNKIKMNDKTVLEILKRSLGEVSEDTTVKFSNMSTLTMTLMYNSNPKGVIECFKNKNILEDKVLMKDINGNEDIFGVKYSVVYKKNIL